MRATPSIPGFSSAIALLGLLTLLLAAPADAATSAEIVSYVNAERAANGIPAGITERPDWSHSCAEHTSYMDQNGVVTHEEDPSMPGYTRGGAWAAETSVLSDGGDWTAAQNPFETAPIHLAALLGPDLAEMGADQSASSGYTCATTWPGYSRPSPATVTGYSYPGNGAAGVPASEVAAESPSTPGEYVGLPAGTETGPYLMAFLDGPSMINHATISAASLSGPAGPVAFERIGSDDPDLGAYLPTPMAFVIPRAPLADGIYHASVSFSYAGTTTPVAFSFSVGDARAGDPGGGDEGDDGDASKPNLSAHPKKRSSDRSPTFGFTMAGATGFECKLDRGGWKGCTSPTTYRGVAAGRHMFRVRATGAASKTPASFRFQIR